MALVTLEQVSLEFGDQIILREAELNIEAGERVCLIGRNGAGKTSLLRLITGELQPDHGDVQRHGGVVISQLNQTLPEEMERSVRDMVASGLDEIRSLVVEYERLSRESQDSQTLRQLEALQRQVDTHGGWNLDQRIDAMVSQLELPADQSMSDLSGGWRRRVSLACALVSEPDLLLLDEPTNHLDLATIDWLEHRVRSYPGSVLFITHDRAFVQKLATRIVEIDRGKLVSWPGDYQRYLTQKDQAIREEDDDNAKFDKKLAEEEAWVRQGRHAPGS